MASDPPSVAVDDGAPNEFALVGWTLMAVAAVALPLRAVGVCVLVSVISYLAAPWLNDVARSAWFRGQHTDAIIETPATYLSPS